MRCGANVVWVAVSSSAFEYSMDMRACVDLRVRRADGLDRPKGRMWADGRREEGRGYGVQESLGSGLVETLRCRLVVRIVGEACER